MPILMESNDCKQINGRVCDDSHSNAHTASWQSSFAFYRIDTVFRVYKLFTQSVNGLKSAAKRQCIPDSLATPISILINACKGGAGPCWREEINN